MGASVAENSAAPPTLESVFFMYAEGSKHHNRTDRYLSSGAISAR